MELWLIQMWDQRDLGEGKQEKRLQNTGTLAMAWGTG